MIAQKHFLHTQTHLRKSLLQHLWISARRANVPHGAHGLLFFSVGSFGLSQNRAVFEQSEGLPMCFSSAPWPRESRPSLPPDQDRAQRGRAAGLEKYSRETPRGEERGAKQGFAPQPFRGTRVGACSHPTRPHLSWRFMTHVAAATAAPHVDV